MNKKISLGLALSLIVISCALTYIFTSDYTMNQINKKVTNIGEREKIYNKIDEIDQKTREHYFGKIDENKTPDAIASGYITALDDKYAVYRTAEENEKRNNELDGTASGLGITVSQDESKYLKIVNVNKGSPAENGGLKVGYQIVAVNGTALNTLSYADATALLKGKVGSSITLTIRNEGNDQEVPVTFAEYEVQSVTYKLIDNIGYIKISDFNKKTPVQFTTAINNAKKDGAKGLVFDLRNNGGGLLAPTLEMLDTLLPEGDIAYSTDKNGKVTTLKKSDASEIDMPMAALVNAKTASASELFCSALRDYNKAVLVGNNTYGKGVMQDTYSLSDGSSITFTVASFRTKKSANFDGVGLKPEYEVSFDAAHASDLSILGTDDDIQLSKAIEVLQPEINKTSKNK